MAQMINIKRVLTSPDIGYASLALCILTTKTIDQAFETLAPDPEFNPSAERRKEIRDAFLLRYNSQLSWPEIGEIFNIKPVAAFKRVRRYAEKVMLTRGRGD
jgi:hypothetical protein